MKIHIFLNLLKTRATFSTGASRTNIVISLALLMNTMANSKSFLNLRLYSIGLYYSSAIVIDLPLKVPETNNTI